MSCLPEDWMCQNVTLWLIWISQLTLHTTPTELEELDVSAGKGLWSQYAKKQRHLL
uniref:Uncharacterized protein n=1 Tax=Arundo donax TaxID=35708 RepID=A0A0A9AQQ4_ARUDO